VDNRCAGSIEQPVNGPILGIVGDQSAHLSSTTDVTTISQSSIPQSPFISPFPRVKILKRIPRGARDAVANEFSRTLNTLMDKPSDQESWSSLFSFAADFLCQPNERGGRRRNLTTAVLNGIRTFDDKSRGLTVSSEKIQKTVGRKGKKIRSENEESAKKAAAKMDEGDIKGAIRQLSSSDTIAEPSLESWKSLILKHPPVPADRRLPVSNEAYKQLLVSSDQVLGAIRSFPPGSAGGPDGLRPQHLKDMTDRQVGGTLIGSLTNLSILC
jgi:hypothetical protein